MLIGLYSSTDESQRSSCFCPFLQLDFNGISDVTKVEARSVATPLHVLITSGSITIYTFIEIYLFQFTGYVHHKTFVSQQREMAAWRCNDCVCK